MIFLGILLLVGAYMAWFYWNRARKMREADGADEFGQKVYRRMFGLAHGERIVAYFNAQMYIGPLRPDVGPSTEDRVLSAALGQGYRGAVAAIALTDRGRCAIAIEHGDDPELESPVVDFTGEGMGMDPLALYGSPKPRIQRGEQAFADHPKYPARGQAPYRPGASGSVGRFQLIHIESECAAPITIWVEPAAVAALLKWAELAKAPSFAHGVPQATA